MKYEVEECKFWQSTVGNNQVILRHPIIHFPTSEGLSERVSGASERANGRASGPVLQSVFLAVIDHSAAGEKF